MLEEARAGTEEEGEAGRVVWLVGGPGSGKAELAREALQGRQGWTVLASCSVTTWTAGDPPAQKGEPTRGSPGDLSKKDSTQNQYINPFKCLVEFSLVWLDLVWFGLVALVWPIWFGLVSLFWWS